MAMRRRTSTVFLDFPTDLPRTTEEENTVEVIYEVSNLTSVGAIARYLRRSTIHHPIFFASDRKGHSLVHILVDWENSPDSSNITGHVYLPLSYHNCL